MKKHENCLKIKLPNEKWETIKEDIISGLSMVEMNKGEKEHLAQFVKNTKQINNNEIITTYPQPSVVIKYDVNSTMYLLELENILLTLITKLQRLLLKEIKKEFRFGTQYKTLENPIKHLDIFLENLN